jgi:hypothetical protein
MALLGVITFRAPILPLVLLAFSWLFGGNIENDICGLFVGHLYYYFKFELPKLHPSLDILITPSWFIWIVENVGGVGRRIVFGGNYHLDNIGRENNNNNNNHHNNGENNQNVNYENNNNSNSNSNNDENNNGHDNFDQNNDEDLSNIQVLARLRQHELKKRLEQQQQQQQQRQLLDGETNSQNNNNSNNNSNNNNIENIPNNQSNTTIQRSEQSTIELASKTIETIHCNDNIDIQNEDQKIQHPTKNYEKNQNISQHYHSYPQFERHSSDVSLGSVSMNSESDTDGIESALRLKHLASPKGDLYK